MVLISLIRYLRGYLRIRIIGYSPERFLNLCSYNHIYLWGLAPGRNAYELNISIRGFRKLKPIIKKTKTRVTIVKRHGLPFFLHKYRKRKMFFLGVLMCIASIYIMSLFVWDIDIQGNRKRTDESIIEFLQTTEVGHGMRISQIDCDRIVKDIRKEYDDIIWVSASIQGTRLIIQVKENSDKMETQGETEEVDSGPTDIVAAKDGIITSIITRSGVPQVHVGDTVSAGDLLISGNVEVKNDAGEVINYQHQESDADIYAQTTYEYSDTLDLTYYVKEYTGYNKSQFYLRVGNRYFQFGSLEHSYEEAESYSEESRLTFGDNFYLPFSYGDRVVREYVSVPKTYTETEFQDILNNNFTRFCDDLEKKGVVIIENNVKIYKGQDNAAAKGTITVTELIGKEQAADVINIDESEEQEGTSDGDTGNVD
ncbi:MAG: sporulation protein YqfD [Lachnospiraceae bacterium]